MDTKTNREMFEENFGLEVPKDKPDYECPACKELIGKDDACFYCKKWWDSEYKERKV